MKLKRFVTLALFTMLICAIFIPNSLAADEGFDHNIDYKTTLATDYKIKSDTEGFYIDLASERLFASASSIKVVAISYNDGGKWSGVSIPTDGLDISKVLNKGGTFKLSTVMPAKKSKTTETTTATTTTATVVTFPSIPERPKMQRLIVNYEVCADITGITAGQWTLTEKDSSAIAKNIQIGSTTDKKNPEKVIVDANGEIAETGTQVTWGYLPTTAKTGINIKDITSSGKQEKTSYIIRVAPDMATRTPASKPKKVSALGLGKLTKFKADYKKEIVKTKAGISFYVDADPTDTPATRTSLDIVSFDKETAKTGVNLAEYGANKADIMGLTLMFWTKATVKKPASAIQNYKTASRGLMVYENVKVSAGKVTVPTKTHYVYNPIKKTWGSMPTGLTDSTTELKVCTKATARPGKENDTTFAQSKSGTLSLLWGDLANSKRGVLAAMIQPPETAGIIFAKPSEMYFKAESTSPSKVVTFDIQGLHSEHASGVVALSTSDVISASGYVAPAGSIVIAPIVTYTTNKSTIKEAVVATAELVGGVVQVTVQGNIACEATVSLKILVGANYASSSLDARGVPTDKKYNKTLAASGTIAVSVPEDKETLKLQPLQIACADINTRKFTASNASSGSTVAKAMALFGTFYISDTESFTFNTDSTQAIMNPVTGTTYTFEVGVTSVGFTGIDTSSTFSTKTGAFTLQHNDTMLITMTATVGETSTKSYFVYKVLDGSGPQMQSASVNASQIIITMDENTTIVSGQSCKLVYTNGTTVLSATGVSSTGSNQVTATFGGTVATGGVLTYQSGTTLKDTVGNLTKPHSVSVGTANYVSFENGIGYASTVIANPRGFANFESAYSDAKICLNSTSTGDVVINGSTANIEYAVSSAGSRWTSASTLSPLTGPITVTSGSYIYLKQGGLYYCFQVIKVTPAAADSVKPTFKTGKFIKNTDGTLQITIDSTEYLSEYGYGLDTSLFTVTQSDTNSTTLTVTNVILSGTRITLNITATDVTKLNSTSIIKVAYKPTQNGVMDVSGNRVDEATTALTMTGY